VNTRTLGRLLVLTLPLFAGSVFAAEMDKVAVGTANSFSDAPLYIAQDKGYFRDENLDVTLTPFDSGSGMVAPLGTGQLDAGAGSASAGLYNAVARGINIKIVADKASSAPGYGGIKLLVRKDLVDSGRYKSLKDLKGMTFAMAGPGVSITASLNDVLTSVGLKYSDVKTVDLAFPEHVLALKNKSVDAGMTAEPAATAAVQAGYADAILRDDQIAPNHELAILLYSDDFAKKRPEVALRFMRAYLRAVRFYNGALKDGHLAGPNADAVIAIIAANTPFKDPQVLRTITPFGCNPNGRVDIESLQHDLDFYASQGLIDGKVSLNDIVDHSFVDATLKTLESHEQ
jgi:NitT/TauT family transport system substrate-binding protein